MSNVISCQLFTLNTGRVTNLPDVSNISFGKERISKEQRSMDGTMIVDLIAIKDTYEMTWDLMSITALESIKAVAESKTDIFFRLKLTMQKAAPETGSYVIDKEVFLSDLTYVPFFYGNGIMWKDVVMKFTEK